MQLTERKIIHATDRSISADDDFGGLFFLAPIVVLIVILAKAFDYAKKGLNAVVVHIPAASDLTAGAATVLAVALVALACFVAGLSLAR